MERPQRQKVPDPLTARALMARALMRHAMIKKRAARQNSGGPLPHQPSRVNQTARRNLKPSRAKIDKITVDGSGTALIVGAEPKFAFQSARSPAS